MIKEGLQYVLVIFIKKRPFLCMKWQFTLFQKGSCLGNSSMKWDPGDHILPTVYGLFDRLLAHWIGAF